MRTPQAATDPFSAACRGEKTGRTPVWFMRQAGRSLPEYRKIRGDASIIDSITTPDVAAEITLQPVRRYGVDAAVLFSDIMAPLWAIDVAVEMVPGVGPVIEQPIRSDADLARIRPLEAEADMPWLGETIEILRNELKVPLIGFAGGPFTLASYLVEGRPSREHTATKSMMYARPALWHGLMDRLTGVIVSTLTHQVEAGANALQLFDSWVGALASRDYDRFVLPWIQRIFDATSQLGVPRIHFGVGTGELLTAMGASGAEVLGVDWRVPLKAAAERAPGVTALQGNLDPAVCFAPWSVVEVEVQQILADRPDRIGHIFNLGHGVLPETNPDTLARIVDLVHETTAE